MVALYVALAAFALTLTGEVLHARRVHRLRHLVFGPTGAPSAWAKGAPFARILASSALAWGLTALVFVEPKVHAGEEIPDEDWRHLLLVYDVSPSMLLEDAGASGDQSRHERARELIESMFERVKIGQYKVSVIATYLSLIHI